MNVTKSALKGALLAALPAAGLAFGDMRAPPVEHYGSIAYQTGGVGVGEAKLMKKDAGHYPLALEFVEQAGNHGEYSAGEHVLIQDAHGKPVLKATADGPFMLVDLPDGRYTVTADNQGRTKVRRIALNGETHDRLAFVWRADSSEH